MDFRRSVAVYIYQSRSYPLGQGLLTLSDLLDLHVIDMAGSKVIWCRTRCQKCLTGELLIPCLLGMYRGARLSMSNFLLLSIIRCVKDG